MRVLTKLIYGISALTPVTEEDIKTKKFLYCL